MMFLRYADEVRDAIARGAPVVALESTIISHGMPYPRNVETARAVEQVVRDAGAVPATIAVLHGVPTVGLTDDELEMLGVPVVVFGARAFPAFYSRDSGFPAPLTLDSPDDVARLLAAKRTLGLPCGVLVANPIPADAEIPRAEMDPIIARALTDMA